MSFPTCTSGATVDCKTPSLARVADPIGRRIYIHEDSLVALTAQSHEAANLILRMAARNVALKFVRHIEQDAALLGAVYLARAQYLVATIEQLWSENASNALKLVGFRLADPRLRDDIHPVLNEDEQIVATCYFSNYFTFATGDKAAESMFADTNDIATLKRIMQEGGGYSDLTLINGTNLVFLDPRIGVGCGKAKAYFSKPSGVPKAHIEGIKRSIYLETKTNLIQVVKSDVREIAGDDPLWEQVLRYLNSAFRRSILKMPEDAFWVEGAQP